MIFCDEPDETVWEIPAQRFDKRDHCIINLYKLIAYYSMNKKGTSLNLKNFGTGNKANAHRQKSRL